MYQGRSEESNEAARQDELPSRGAEDPDGSHPVDSMYCPL